MQQLSERFTDCYVTETAITFEVDVPTVQEFERRITNADQVSLFGRKWMGKVVEVCLCLDLYARAAHSWTTELCLFM